MLVVIAILAALAGLLLPALAGGKSRARAVSCMNNVKQLGLAWRLYAEENNDLLLAASDYQKAPNWCAGWLDYTGDPENTNAAVILASPLYPYCPSTSTFLCPEDKSGRIRSMSMNGWMGGPAWSQSGSGWQVFKTLSYIDDPANRFVFIDEREDSINDGYFLVDMKGYPADPAGRKIGSYPGSRHNRQAALAFADGHATLHLWKDPRTMPPARAGKALPLNISSPDNPDVFWLQNAATRKKQ